MKMIPDKVLHITENITGWRAERDRHIQRIESILGDYLELREQQVRNPVLDFLFEYYAFRPGLLMRWSPGYYAILEEAAFEDITDLIKLQSSPVGFKIDPETFPAHRVDSLEWIIELLKATQDRPPSFGCFGMHEWAMVYRTENIRHHYIPLRLSPDEINAFVESRPIACTHYDAFRFFTKPARPLNIHQPAKSGRYDLEQPGCLHTNMDLYKWAYKFYPWTPSMLIADTFELAVETRILDMQASPYDLREYGLQPVKIETDEGRLDYKRRQQDIWKRGIPLREKLVKCYEGLLDMLK